MAATKYQVLYRFMNDTLETPVTNNFDIKYEPLFEFYTDPDHRIFDSNPDTQNEEMEKQQAIITEANSASNPKHDMLFVFNGTKKVPHKQWVPDEIGYVVRDWQSIRSKVGSNGDYSKDFTTLNAKTPEDGGTVVCTKSVMQKYFSKPYIQKNFGGVTTAETIKKAIINSTIFKIENEDWRVHAVPGPNSIIQNSWYSMPGMPGRTSYDYWYDNLAQPGSEIILYQSNIIVDPVEGVDYIKDYKAYPRVGTGYYSHPLVSKEASTIPIAWISDAKMYKSISVTQEDLKTTTIPGHYEDSPKAPYAIKDQYTRIENSPWIINCTVGSLDAALTKARLLIDMIGIENVKIIKVVPFDQHIKIK